MNRFILPCLVCVVLAPRPVDAQAAKPPALNKETAQRAIEIVEQKVDEATKEKALEAADVLLEKAAAARKARPVPPAAGPTPEKKKKPSQPERVRVMRDGMMDYRKSQGVVIFQDNVSLVREIPARNEQNLIIWCGELEIRMNTGEQKSAAVASSATVGGFDMKDVKKAIARATPGGMVVIWRKTEKGEQLAVCREATYDGATGDIQLKGKPEVLEDMKNYAFSRNENDFLNLLKNGNINGSVSFQGTSGEEAHQLRRRLFSHVPGQTAVEEEPKKAPAPKAGATENAATTTSQ